MKGANGQSVELLTINGGPVEVDVDIADLVRVLNDNGYPTRASCSGHGYRPATIALGDGRWITISRDMAEFKMIEALFPIGINGPPSPCGEV